MKIYVITKGEYSDYHICATTTDKDRAEFLREMASTIGEYGEEAKIEEFDDYAELNPIKGELYKVYWICDDSGNCKGVFTSQEFYPYGNYLDEAMRFEEEELHGEITREKLSGGGYGYICLVVAESKEKAEKIGIDMIQKYRAEKMGL